MDPYGGTDRQQQLRRNPIDHRIDFRWTVRRLYFRRDHLGLRGFLDRHDHHDRDSLPPLPPPDTVKLAVFRPVTLVVGR